MKSSKCRISSKWLFSGWWRYLSCELWISGGELTWLRLWNPDKIKRSKIPPLFSCFIISYAYLCFGNSDSDCCFYLGSEINDPHTHGDADRLRKHPPSQRLQQLSSHVSMSLQTEKESFCYTGSCIIQQSLAYCGIVKKSSGADISSKACEIKLCWQCVGFFLFVLRCVFFCVDDVQNLSVWSQAMQCFQLDMRWPCRAIKLVLASSPQIKAA